jgi:thiol-disulfide isomerase/thioredoxin
MIISIAPLAIIGSTGVNWYDSSNTGNPSPSSTGPTDRVVLAELFTAASCTFCPTSSSSIDRLSDEYGPERLAVIEYHTWASDPLSNDDSRARNDYYEVEGIPDMYFDGSVRNGGGGSGKYAKYESYKSSIESELEKLTNIVIAVSGDINTTGGTIEISII